YNITTLVFSPDSQVIATGQADYHIWGTWGLGTDSSLRKIRGHKGLVAAVAYSVDGKRLGSGSHDKTRAVGDVASGKETALMTGHTDIVSTVAFSPDGKMVASAGWDHTIRLWDADTGEEIGARTAHQGTVWTSAFSTDGKTLATGGAD